jgi:hypothetical protein
VNTSTVSFPSKLNSKALSATQLDPRKIEDALRKLRATLESMLTLYCRTPSGREQELKRKKENAKLLWTIGKYGKLETIDDEPSILITLADFKEHIGYGKHKLKTQLQELSKHGVEGTHNKGKIRVRFAEKTAAAFALKHYTRLLQNYGRAR